MSDASRVAKFATSASISLEDSAAQLTVIKAIYQAQAGNALQQRYGIGAPDRADFYAWCKQNHTGRMTDAVSKQMHAGDVSGWAPLASQWLASTAPSLNAISAAGIPTRTQGQGSGMLHRRNVDVAGGSQQGGIDLGHQKEKPLAGLSFGVSSVTTERTAEGV